MSGAYSDNLSPYDVRHDFVSGFGTDPNWWLVLIVTLAILMVMELMYKFAKRNFMVEGRWPPWKQKPNTTAMTAEDLDLEVWQEMEQDPSVKERFRRSTEDNDDDLDTTS